MAKAPKKTVTPAAAPQVVPPSLPVVNVVILDFIKNETATVGKTSRPLAEVEHLIAAQYVIANPNGPDSAGHIEVAVTPLGVAYLEQLATQGNTMPVENTASAEKPSFEFFDFDVEAVVPRKRGRSADPTYPFEKLEIGRGFIVPASAARPNPARSLASTVSSASRRLFPKVFSLEAQPDKSVHIKRMKDATEPRVVKKRAPKAPTLGQAHTQQPALTPSFAGQLPAWKAPELDPNAAQE